MTKSPHTGGERGIVPDWRAIGITRRLEVHDPSFYPMDLCSPVEKYVCLIGIKATADSIRVKGQNIQDDGSNASNSCYLKFYRILTVSEPRPLFASCWHGM